MHRESLCSTFHQVQLFINRWLGFCKGSSLRRLLGSPIRQSWLGIKVLSRDSVLIFWRVVILQSTSKYDKVLQDHSCNCVSVCYIYTCLCSVLFESIRSSPLSSTIWWTCLFHRCSRCLHKKSKSVEEAPLLLRMVSISRLWSWKAQTQRVVPKCFKSFQGMLPCCDCRWL